MSDGVRILRPARKLQGSLRLPGDKSISHRYAMLAALAEGTTRISNYSDGADCASTLACIKALGCDVESKDGVVSITGRAGKLAQPSAPLDCGNSGSTMRMLSGILAGQPLDCRLIGDESLSRRPMRRIVEPLTAMGASIEASGKDGRPPLRIRAPRDGKLNGTEYRATVPSAQVKSAVLFAGLQAEGLTSYEEPALTRDHSELALRAFGAEVRQDGKRVMIRGDQRLRAIEAAVPGDISSASFFLCGAAILPGSSLIFDALGMNPTRALLFDLLAGMGARLQVLNVEELNGELIGTVKMETGKLRGCKISGTTPAQIIDELPVLAAIAPWTETGISIRDAKELRVKESDRIAAVAENLRRMGAKVEEHDDGITVPGNQKLVAAELDACGDHRIAMAFAITSLRVEGESKLHGAESVAISFPRFWEMLESVTA